MKKQYSVPGFSERREVTHWAEMPTFPGDEEEYSG